MNWSKVKTVTIILLAAVNIFFAVNLRVQYVNTYLIDQRSLDTTVELLARSGITLDSERIPHVKPTFVVYENSHDDESHLRVVEKTARTNEFTQHMINNGTKCIIDATGDEYEFSDSNPFEVTYKKKTSLQKLPDDDYLAAFTSTGSAATGADIDRAAFYRVERAINDFILGDISKSTSLEYGIDVDSIRYDTSNDWYVAKCFETVDGVRLCSSGLTFVVCDVEVVYMTGELLLPTPETGYTTDGQDQLNVLFTEKAYIESERLRFGSDIFSETYEIISLDMGYIVSWNSDRSSFYLIPAWNIVYSDGTSRLRNVINGSIYAT